MKVRLFGVFRDFSSEGFLTLSVSGGESVREIKNLLGTKLCQLAQKSFDIRALVSKSVLANGDRILEDIEIVDTNELSVLPPVCGG
jgi:molybdopterin converting factor small subunit